MQTEKKKSFKLRQPVVRVLRLAQVLRIIRIIRSILEWLILIVAFGVLTYIFIETYQGKAPNFFGKNILHVVTGSMEPTISTDDYILVDRKYVGPLKQDDIIAYYTEDPEIYGKLVIHRIIGINPDGTYVTQGDANLVADELAVRQEQVLGLYVERIMFLNWLKSFMDFRKILLILGVALFLTMAAYEVRTVTNLKNRVDSLKQEAIEEYRNSLNVTEDGMEEEQESTGED